MKIPNIQTLVPINLTALAARSWHENSAFQSPGNRLAFIACIVFFPRDLGCLGSKVRGPKVRTPGIYGPGTYYPRTAKTCFTVLGVKCYLTLITVLVNFVLGPQVLIL